MKRIAALVLTIGLTFLVTPPASSAMVLFGAVRWDSGSQFYSPECYKAGKLIVDPNTISRVGRGATLRFQSDGNLVVYRQYGRYFGQVKAFWNTRTVGADRICFQGDSNVVIYRGSRAVWQLGKQPISMRLGTVSFGWPAFGDGQLQFVGEGRVTKVIKIPSY